MIRRCLATALSVLIIPTILVAGPVRPASAALAPVQVVTGYVHTCALAPSGQSYCWGYNSNGQLGDSTATSRSIPVAVQQGGVTFTSITAGGWHTCGLTSAGAAYCWGSNWASQLGDSTATSRSIPVAVQQGGMTFTSITAGDRDTCGLTPSGQSYCWGYNNEGELGDSTATSRSIPVAVQQGGVTFTSIIAGNVHTCGLTGAGQAWCWGYNAYGQLGDTTTTDRHTPVAVQQGGVTFASITTGAWHTCGLTSAGAAYCWGYNGNGQLGDNTTTQSLTPVAVQQGGVTFTSITGGFDHTCGLTSAGAAYCWGYNVYGQLGDNTTADRHTPVAVGGGPSWAAVVSSGTASHTCAVKLSSQLIYCWGLNSNGQLGDQTTTNRYSPVQASYLVTVAGVAVAIPVDPELTLIVTSVASALSCGDVTTTVTSAANAVPLGHTSSTTAHPIGGQSLNIKTNAASGYTVYISYGAAMVGAGSGHTFANMGGTNASPAAWPANGTEAFGYTTESSTLSGTAGRFHSPAKWAALTTSTGQEIMRNAATPGANGDTNCIAYQASVAGNTPADAAYSTTVLYSVMPLF
jgi:alpha-tubulin suppressor-like RCC1 family protein